MTLNRPNWDTYFMEIASLVKERATCMRRKVGAIIVKEKRILTTGYNGAPTGVKHCKEVGCLREKLKIKSGERHELCRGVHAEQNALLQGAKFGVKVGGGILYVTDSPCFICGREIINAGIVRVVYKEGYEDENGIKFMKEAGIEVIKYKGENYEIE